jgi:hypothetical protein
LEERNEKKDERNGKKYMFLWVTCNCLLINTANPSATASFVFRNTA